MRSTSGVRRIPRRRIAAIGIFVVVVVVGSSLAAYRLLGWRPSAASPGPAIALAAPRYVEEAAAAGIDHRYDGDFTYFVGGGVATFDCDTNGLPDLYFAGGAEPAALYRNVSTAGGALRFQQVPDPTTDLDSVTGAYPLDIDSDGILDLVVLRIGPDAVLRGLGDCRFESATTALGLPRDDAWTVAFSATWESPTATLPTLAFGDYLEIDEKQKWTGVCPDDRFVRPAVGGAAYGPSLSLTPSWCTLSMLFSDWDRSGRRDLRVSNDRHYYTDGEEQLWRIEPGVAPVAYTRDDGWQRLRIWGMGIASQDITGDGYPELYLTSQGDNKLQTLADGPSEPDYADIALRRGATAHRPYIGGDPQASTAWHPAFEDVNNDTFMDLYVSKGNVESQTDYAAKDPSNLMIGQADGRFVERAMDAGIVRFDRARGAAVVDLNADGLLDLVQVIRRKDVELWRNVGTGTAAAPAPMGHWLDIDVEQDGSNRNAVGAWVAVKVGDRQIERELTVGGGHASGQLVPLHFGLGDATRAEVRVTWPDGELGQWLPADADRSITLRRGASAVESATR